jgi:hypothetical protein
MADNIFKTVNMKAGDAQKSYTWYRNQVRNLGSGVSGLQLIRNETLTNRIKPGEMYLFMYDPKHKDTLPYYDTMPLVLPFRKVPDGFYGINLHYLPYMMRFRILGLLSDYATGKDEDTRIQLSWRLLNSSSRLHPAKFAVKHYLNSHVKSRLYKIPYTDWVTASQLPVEKFVGAQKTKVWQDFNRSQ